MKTYAAILKFVPNPVERRRPYREAHLKYIYGLRDSGRIIISGPLVDPLDGALIVYRAESLAEVEKIIQNDPYYRANLWPEISIREWTLVVASHPAFLATTADSSFDTLEQAIEGVSQGRL
jgi:uncharacterized protein YciI